jgi:hypothetical protein
MGNESGEGSPPAKEIISGTRVSFSISLIAERFIICDDLEKNLSNFSVIAGSCFVK